MTVYLDQIFFWNALADLALLAAVQRLLGLPVHKKRTLLAALAGGLYGVLAVLPALRWLAHPFWELAAALGLTALVFGRAAQLPRYWLLFLVTACGLAGAVAAFQGADGTLLRRWPLFLAAFAACYGLLSLVFPGTAGPLRGETPLLPVRLRHRGREVRFVCLADTGNGLRDPEEGRPVLVVWRQALLPVLPGVEERGPLRYQSLGNPAGTMAWFRADCVTIGDRVLRGQPVAIAPSPLSDGAGYVALWNGEGAGSGSPPEKRRKGEVQP